VGSHDVPARSRPGARAVRRAALRAAVKGAPAPGPPAKPTHLPFLDGLRAVAILGVVAYHTWGHTPSLHKYSWLQFAWAGNHGVELFFVISGFCLAYPTLRRLHEGGAYSFDFRSYIVRRMVRILPPFWVALTAL